MHDLLDQFRLFGTEYSYRTRDFMTKIEIKKRAFLKISIKFCVFLYPY